MSIIDSDHQFIGIIYFLLRKIVGFFVRILWIKDVRGIKYIPLDRPAILAFNHQSFMDFIAFASVAPKNVHFLAAEKFFTHPVLKLVMILAGQIRVNRHDQNKDETHASVERHVRKGKLVGIFPEGTRSPYRFEMLKAFTGVAQFALKHHVPIIPVGIIGTYDVWPKHSAFPALHKSIEIDIGKPLYFDQHHGMHDDRQICMFVTEKVIKEIEILSGKKYPYYSLV